MNEAEPEMVRAVRDAIAAAVPSGMSLRELSRRSGVDATSLSLFSRGMREMSFARVAKLCEVLGLELKSVKRKAKSKA